MDKLAVLKQIKAEYERYMESEPEIRYMYSLLRRGKATQAAGLQMASLSGDALADSLLGALLPELGPGELLSLEDALAIIPDALKSNSDYVGSYLYQLQTKLDEQAGIGLKPITAKFDNERAIGLAESSTTKPLEDIADQFRSQVKNFSMHEVDESMRLTAESRAAAGLEVLVSRKYDDKGVHNRKDPCQWCIDRECDELPYQEAYELGVFERHDGCECLITYTNDRGDTTYQASKGKWYESSEEALEKRKNYGL